MIRTARLLSASYLLCGLVPALAHAQAPTAVTGTTAAQSAPAASPGATAARAEPPATAQTRQVSVQAGTGVLLRLPQPAATVMSAEPAIARVQPASPTSLFLMGVSAGRTTVIATNDTGSAIVQVRCDRHARHGKPACNRAWWRAQPRRRRSVRRPRKRSRQRSPRRCKAHRTCGRVAPERILSLAAQSRTPAQPSRRRPSRGVTWREKSTVIDELTVLSGLQVNVRVRIAEIDRQITRQLGFNWQALGAANTWRFGLRTGAGATNAAITPLLPLGLGSFAGAVTPNQIGAGVTSGNWDVNGIVDALAADQLITILAEPNLTAQSGETASFLAGGEFPIPIAGSTSNGAATITVEFKQFGVSLAVVPTVLSPSRLNLRVRPEVSQLSTNGAVSVPVAGGTLTIPALTVRRAETTIELGSGQSFAIAGLLQKTSLDSTNALPGIGELPVIGALFKSNDFQRGESELVIIVTPYLVRPASSPADLHTPMDNFKPAIDLDRILFGRQLAPASPGSGPLDAGFILK